MLTSMAYIAGYRRSSGLAAATKWASSNLSFGRIQGVWHTRRVHDLTLLARHRVDVRGAVRYHTTWPEPAGSGRLGPRGSGPGPPSAPADRRQRGRGQQHRGRQRRRVLAPVPPEYSITWSDLLFRLHI
jgi:hypothetical protein